MKELLSPKQVARAIGVSESSLKRWCDQGVIPTVRTAGGHRRLTLGDVLRFVRDKSHPLVCPSEIGLPSVSEPTEKSIERGRLQLVDALLTGDDRVSQRLIVDLYLAKHPLSTICDDVIAGAFHEIGSRWSCQQAQVYQERRACEIMLRVIHSLRESQHGMNPNLRAVGCTPEGDPYTLSNSMAELILREVGWNASSLGASVPIESLATAIRDSRPRLVWLSVTSLSNVDRFLSEYAELHQTAVDNGAAVVVGGQALTPDIRQRMVYSSFCDGMRHLESFARTLNTDRAAVDHGSHDG